MGLDKKKVTAVGSVSYCFGVLPFLLILSLRKLRGFLLYGFPEENSCVFCLLCFIAMHVILLVKDHNASLNDKNLTWYQS